MGWNPFKRAKSESYEDVLQSLSLKISQKQEKLSVIRLRQRRTTFNITLYILLTWIIWTTIWYFNKFTWFGIHSNSSNQEDGDITIKFLLILPVLSGPVFILFIRRIVTWFYTRQGSSEEKQLMALRVKQREKIEEIKTKTNYYTTKNLLERYDDPHQQSQQQIVDSPASAKKKQQDQLAMRRNTYPSLPPGAGNGDPNSPSPAPRSSISGPTSSNTGTPQPPGSLVFRPGANGAGAVPGSPFIQQQQQPMVPIPTPKKQWYDRLADVILGEDPSSLNSPATKYALICQNCFSHNGLVPESQFETMQYKCPKCNFFNQSQQSLKSASSQQSTQNILIPKKPSSSLSSVSSNDASKSTPSKLSLPPLTADDDDADGEETAMKEVGQATKSTARKGYKMDVDE